VVLSISRQQPHGDEAQALLALRQAARQLESALYGAPNEKPSP
jgi:hypothetical protein